MTAAAVTTSTALTLLLAGCGGDDPGGGGTPAGDGVTQDATEPDAGGGGDFPVPTGTITVDGTAVEVSGLESSFRGTTGDFQVCTYSGGGDEGFVQIQVYFRDSEMFEVTFGDPHDLAPSAFYTPDRDDPMTNVAGNSTEDLMAELTGDRAVGTATFDDGLVVDFDVDCAR